MKTIRIPRSIVKTLLNAARQTPEHECCGLVSAQRGVPHRVYPVTNVADEPQHRFTMDPAGQIAAMKSMRENNESLFAIYHSHPQGPAQPSATDMAQASYPEALYLIISLQGEAATKLRGFYLQPDSFAAVDLHIS